MTEAEKVAAAAQEQGLRAERISEGLYTIHGTWCLVTLSLLSGKWRVSRYRLSNRRKTWRTTYHGTVLTTAMRKAAEWRN